MAKKKVRVYKMQQGGGAGGQNVEPAILINVVMQGFLGQYQEDKDIYPDEMYNSLVNQGVDKATADQVVKAAVQQMQEIMQQETPPPSERQNTAPEESAPVQADTNPNNIMNLAMEDDEFTEDMIMADNPALADDEELETAKYGKAISKAAFVRNVMKQAGGVSGKQRATITDTAEGDRSSITPNFVQALNTTSNEAMMRSMIESQYDQLAAQNMLPVARRGREQRRQDRQMKQFYKNMSRMIPAAGFYDRAQGFPSQPLNIINFTGQPNRGSQGMPMQGMSNPYGIKSIDVTRSGLFGRPRRYSMEFFPPYQHAHSVHNDRTRVLPGKDSAGQTDAGKKSTPEATERKTFIPTAIDTAGTTTGNNSGGGGTGGGRTTTPPSPEDKKLEGTATVGGTEIDLSKLSMSGVSANPYTRHTMLGSIDYDHETGDPIRARVDRMVPNYGYTADGRKVMLPGHSIVIDDSKTFRGSQAARVVENYGKANVWNYQNEAKIPSVHQFQPGVGDIYDPFYNKWIPSQQYFSPDRLKLRPNIPVIKPNIPGHTQLRKEGGEPLPQYTTRGEFTYEDGARIYGTQNPYRTYPSQQTYGRGTSGGFLNQLFFGAKTNPFINYAGSWAQQQGPMRNADGSVYQGEHNNPYLKRIDVHRSGLFGRPKKWTATYGNANYYDPNTARELAESTTAGAGMVPSNRTSTPTVDNGMAPAGASYEEIVARETEGMTGRDRRKTKANLRRARRNDMLDYFRTPEERGDEPNAPMTLPIKPAELLPTAADEPRKPIGITPSIDRLPTRPAEAIETKMPELVPTNQGMLPPPDLGGWMPEAPEVTPEAFADIYPMGEGIVDRLPTRPSGLDQEALAKYKINQMNQEMRQADDDMYMQHLRNRWEAENIDPNAAPYNWQYEPTPEEMARTIDLTPRLPAPRRSTTAKPTQGVAGSTWSMPTQKRLSRPEFKKAMRQLNAMKPTSNEHDPKLSPEEKGEWIRYRNFEKQIGSLETTNKPQTNPSFWSNLDDPRYIADMKRNPSTAQYLALMLQERKKFGNRYQQTGGELTKYQNLGEIQIEEDPNAWYQPFPGTEMPANPYEENPFAYDITQAMEETDPVTEPQRLIGEDDEFSIDMKRKDMYNINWGNVVQGKNLAFNQLSNLIERADLADSQRKGYQDLAAGNQPGVWNYPNERWDPNSGLIPKMGATRYVRQSGGQTVGGEVYMSEQEIQDFLNRGGELEYI